GDAQIDFREVVDADGGRDVLAAGCYGFDSCLRRRILRCGTLVCRKSLFTMMVKLGSSKAADVLDGFTRAFCALPQELRQTLTYDQGKEMALHKSLADNTGMTIYFCDPHSPWQRGLNENTNGLLRQYLPKGTDLGVYSQRELDEMAWELNTRPRKSLGWRSAAEVFYDDASMAKAGLIPTVALGL
ncbi:IS30 family transposase, partial [Polaromonas glacialis]|uniref:IS30 family transposase n=1 Tax=Polaromonas glacialis TaxID=866564 RepID=UPI0018DEAF76